MINVRMDLIRKELAEDGFEYKRLKLSNKFLDRLFNKYNCIEYCEKFYDSEPDVSSELYDEYRKYNSGNGGSKEAYDEVCKIYKEYDKSERRLTFNNWQDPYGKGVWMMSQYRVDRCAKDILKIKIKRCGVSNRDRLYYAIKGDQIRIYWYGRDAWYVDYWFVFQRK